MRLGEIDVVPGLPFGGQPLGFDVAGQVQGVPGIAELDGDADAVTARARSELGKTDQPSGGDVAHMWHETGRTTDTASHPAGSYGSDQDIQERPDRDSNAGPTA